jgi:hypothetical protein
MKWAWCGVILVALAGSSLAETGPGMKGAQLADASTDACIASCSTENASCKRVCPVTFSAPCLNACDSRYKTCTQGCQTK